MRGNQNPITTGSVIAKWDILNLVQTDRKRVKGISLGSFYKIQIPSEIKSYLARVIFKRRFYSLFVTIPVAK